MIVEKPETTIKINELLQLNPAEKGRQEFNFGCNSRITSITVRASIWKKLTDAASNYPQRIALMSNTSRQASDWETRTANRTMVHVRGTQLQVFERKTRQEQTLHYVLLERAITQLG